MLPGSRADGYLYQIPKYEIKAKDVKGFMNEFKGFHDFFSDCFHRANLDRIFFYTWPASSVSLKENRSNLLH